MRKGSVLGPLLFTLSINSLGQNFPNAAFHFYADDSVIYYCASMLSKAFEYMQRDFDRVQAQLCQLKLVLNAEKAKLMLFSNSKKQVLNQQILTSQGIEIEVVSTYKYLGYMIDDHNTFKTHIQNLGKKLKLKVGFYFRNKSCFSLEARRRLVEATSLPVLEYGDLLYINASAHCLHMLDIVYHGATRFITNSRALSHHCTLYSKVNCPSLFLRRLSHWYVFIYKAILGKLPCFVTAYVPETCPPWVTVSGHGPYDCC